MSKSKLSDIIRFTGKFFAKPRSTGSLLPSSSFLGRQMSKDAGIKQGEAVVELGPGTGAITMQLLESGMDPKFLFCIETDAKLCEILRRRFPCVNIINDSAENISKIMQSVSAPVCAVVSSLPLLSLPEELCRNVMRESEAVLAPKGRFVQFTYNLKRKPAAAFKFAQMRHMGHTNVILNVPPARVDVFEKL